MERSRSYRFGWNGEWIPELAEREPRVRAIVRFSTAGSSWERSPELRARLLAAVPHITAAVFLIHASNDYSINPGKALRERLSQLASPEDLPLIETTPNERHDLPHGPAISVSDVFVRFPA